MICLEYLGLLAYFCHIFQHSYRLKCGYLGKTHETLRQKAVHSILELSVELSREGYTHYYTCAAAKNTGCSKPDFPSQTTWQMFLVRMNIKGFVAIIAMMVAFFHIRLLLDYHNTQGRKRLEIRLVQLDSYGKCNGMKIEPSLTSTQRDFGDDWLCVSISIYCSVCSVSNKDVPGLCPVCSLSNKDVMSSMFAQ